MLFGKFLRKAIVDHGVISLTSKFLEKLAYKFNHILNVVGELDT